MKKMTLGGVCGLSPTTRRRANATRSPSKYPRCTTLTSSLMTKMTPPAQKRAISSRSSTSVRPVIPTSIMPSSLGFYS